MRDVPEPACGRDEVVLRVGAASICGTDLKIARHGHRKLNEGQRIVLGHEVVGTVVEIGREVSGFRPGQRLGVAPNIGCGQCRECVAGRSNYCASFSAIGINIDGAHATHLRLPSAYLQQGNLVPLPDELSDCDASLLEPMSCVIGGCEAAEVRPRDVVVIFGAGPMGLLHVMLCRALGAAQVIVVDRNDYRLERARELGADVGVNPLAENVSASVREQTDGQGADVAVVACPVPSVQEEALTLLATGGRLSLFAGLPRDAGPIRFDSNLVHYRNLTVTGSTGGTIENFRSAVRMAAAGQLPLSKVVSNVFSLHEMDAAYAKAMEGAGGKVVLVDVQAGHT